MASAAFAARAVERLITFFGPRATVSTITPQVLKRYERERVRKVRVYKTKKGDKIVADKRPVSSAMIRREFVVLSAALNHAITNGRLTAAPKIILPPAGAHRTRYLEKDEIERLLANCIEPHLKLFVTLAINTGARKGALLDLQWPQVDFTNRIIYLNPEGRIQNNKRRAVVPMNQLLYDTLLKTKTQREEAAEEERQKTGQIITPCAHVIAYRNGPIENVRIGFRMSCQRAGLKGVTPHTLRHTAGTLMALAGIDLFLIAKVLGHSVQKTTELYAHFQPSYLRGAVDALANAMPVAAVTPKKDAAQTAATFH
jgi:integrase